MNPDGCFLCGELTHWRDLCPLLQPATSLAEHQRRLQLYVDRWADGAMTTEMKREAIRAEHDMWAQRPKGHAA